jgi:hypothetical protein
LTDVDLDVVLKRLLEAGASMLTEYIRVEDSAR